MKRDPTILSIIEKIAEESGLPVEVVDKVIMSEFRMVTRVMRETAENKSDKTMFMNFFGKFKVKPARRKYLDSFADNEFNSNFSKDKEK